MLCPSCGTEVGEKLALCPKCEAEVRARHQSAGGTQIGAIRPALRVVHLKPGEQHPDAPRSSAPAQSFGGSQAELPPPDSDRSDERVSIHTQYPKKKLPPNVLVISGLVIVLAAWFAVWLIRSPKDLALFENPAQPDTPQPFSHIVIHQKKEVVVDGHDVIGAFTVDGVTAALERVEASMNVPKNYLELLYYSKEGPPPPEDKTAPPPVYDSGKPILRIVLQFGQLSGKLDREKLQSYLIDYTGGSNPVRMLNTYQKQLASFGEVTSLTGTVKANENVRGEMNSHRAIDSGGSTVEVSWTLGFNVPLQIQGDSQTAAAKKQLPPTPSKK